MDLRQDLLALLRSAYELRSVDGDGQTYLITRHNETELDPPVRLHLLSEELFERYVRRLVSLADEPSVQETVGLVFVHIDEAIVADSAAGPLTDVGLRRRRIGWPTWFEHRLSRPSEAPSSAPGSSAAPTAVWVADPPTD